MLAGLNEPHSGLGIGAAKVARRTELEEELAKERELRFALGPPAMCQSQGSGHRDPGHSGRRLVRFPFRNYGRGVRVVEGSCERVVSQVWKKCVFWG